MTNQSSSQARSKASLVLLAVVLISMLLAWAIPQAVERVYHGHYSPIVPLSPVIALIVAMISVGTAASFVCRDEAFALSRFALGPAAILVLLYVPAGETFHSLSFQYLWLVVLLPIIALVVVMQVKSLRLSLNTGLLCDQQRIELARKIGLSGTLIYSAVMIFLGDQLGWSMRAAFFLGAVIGCGPFLALESYAGFVRFMQLHAQTHGSGARAC